MRKLFLLFLIPAVFPALVFAGASPSAQFPGTQTMWDRIMIQQSYRNLRKGMEFMQRGQYQNASREFGKAAVENPHEPWPHVMLGSALYWLGQVDQAMTEYDEALKIDSKNAQAHQLMGIAHAWKGDAQSALKSFLAAATYEPNRSDVHMDIGSIYESLGRFSDALDSFRRAVLLEPNHPLYRYQLGLLQTRLGMEDDAMQSFRAAISLYPDYEDAMLELAALHERNKEFKDALSLYRRAVKIKPRDSVARFRYAKALAENGKSADTKDVLEQAFSLMPNSKEDGIALSLAYSGSKSGDGKQNTLESGAGANSAQNERKNESEQKKSSPVDSLKKNLERIPLNQEVNVQAEIVYLPKAPLKLVKADKTEKRSSLGQALKDSMDEKPAAMSIKRQYAIPASDPQMRRKMIDSVLAELKQSLAEVPDDGNMRMALNIDAGKPGSASGGAGGSDQGAAGTASGPGRNQNRNAKVTYNPRVVGNDMGLWVMGSSWLELVSEAVSEIDKELPKSRDAQLWITAGLGHVILGESDAAVEKFSRAAELGGGTNAFLGKAVAYIEMGDEEAAIAACKAALKTDPENEIATQNLKWLTSPSTVD